MAFENLATPTNVWDGESQFYAFWASAPSTAENGQYKLNVTFLRYEHASCTTNKSAQIDKFLHSGSANIFIGYNNAVPVPEAGDYKYAIEGMPEGQNYLLMTMEGVVPGTVFKLHLVNLVLKVIENIS